MQWHPSPSERRAHASLKWSTFPDNELALWVADMDCRPPPCVRETIDHAVEHGIFGYGTEPPGSGMPGSSISKYDTNGVSIVTGLCPSLA